MNKTTLLQAQAKEVIEMKFNGKSFFGRNVHITSNNSNSTITIDGVVVESGKLPKIQIEVLGSCDSIETASGDITVHNAAQTIKTMSGDVTCGAVYGPVSTMSGDVKCGDVSGHISTMSGDVRRNSKG